MKSAENTLLFFMKLVFFVETIINITLNLTNKYRSTL